jgi:hypothetical protein
MRQPAVDTPGQLGLALGVEVQRWYGPVDHRFLISCLAMGFVEPIAIRGMTSDAIVVTLY